MPGGISGRIELDHDFAQREAFREAFDDFEISRVARYSRRQVERLLDNPGIVRHRGKIEAVINNAARAREARQEFGSLDALLWSFRPARNRRFDASRARTPESTEMSQQLRQRGWKFVGPTTCYSFMQAMGLVNDHHPQCFRHSALTRAG